MNKILIIDDDRELCALIKRSVQAENIEADFCNTGKEGLQKLREQEYQLVVLDVMMPGMDGFETLEEIRKENSLPILMFTSKNDSISKVRGLRAGADDYLTKPFVIDELVARIKAHLRRQARLGENAVGGDVLRIGDIALDRKQLTVTRGGAPVELSTREFELLDYLMRNAGQTLSREKIFRDVWKTEYGDIGTVAINIKNLRAKIDPDWAYIKTVWGSGYQFVSRSSFGESKQTEAR